MPDDGDSRYPELVSATEVARPGTVAAGYVVPEINDLERCTWRRDGHCPCRRADPTTMGPRRVVIDFDRGSDTYSAHLFGKGQPAKVLHTGSAIDAGRRGAAFDDLLGDTCPPSVCYLDR